MAQLKDLIVNGASRLIGDVFTNKIQITAISAPTASNGTAYGPGTNGQVLKSNGTSIYWAADNNSITGVKGNSESSYRTGNVNITAANIGALALTGGTLSGGISVSHATSNDIGYLVQNTNKSHQVGLIVGASSGNGGIFDFTKNKWIVYSDTSGNITLNGNAASASTIVSSGLSRHIFVTTSASVPSGAVAGDIVLVKV